MNDLEKPILMYNAIRTPDGTVLTSRATHDYQTHVDQVTKREYMVDGGTSYERRSAWGDEEILSLYSDAPHEQLREVVTWGTYGPNGDQPFKLVAVKDMDTDHIEAVLRTQTHLRPQFRQFLYNELIQREQMAS